MLHSVPADHTALLFDSLGMSGRTTYSLLPQVLEGGEALP